jgi:uncharacterized membrane protein YtjA (UPF0391 family)
LVIACVAIISAIPGFSGIAVAPRSSRILFYVSIIIAVMAAGALLFGRTSERDSGLFTAVVLVAGAVQLILIWLSQRAHVHDTERRPGASAHAHYSDINIKSHFDRRAQRANHRSSSERLYGIQSFMMSGCSVRGRNLA